MDGFDEGCAVGELDAVEVVEEDDTELLEPEDGDASRDAQVELKVTVTPCPLADVPDCRSPFPNPDQCWPEEDTDPL